MTADGTVVLLHRLLKHSSRVCMEFFKHLRSFET